MVSNFSWCFFWAHSVELLLVLLFFWKFHGNKFLVCPILYLRQYLDYFPLFFLSQCQLFLWVRGLIFCSNHHIVKWGHRRLISTMGNLLMHCMHCAVWLPAFASIIRNPIIFKEFKVLLATIGGKYWSFGVCLWLPTNIIPISPVVDLYPVIMVVWYSQIV